MAGEHLYPEVLQIEKEPLKQSDRFKVFLSSAIFEILILAAGWASIKFGWDIPTELLRDIAVIIGGLAATFIAGRSYRNTS